MKKRLFFLVLRRGLTLLCAPAVLCGAVFADEIQNPEPKIKPPHTFNRKLFLAEASALAASAAFDWTTTSRCQDRGCQESASSWAIGHFPRNSQIARYGASWFAADAAAAYFTEKSRSKWVRWLGRAYLAYEIQDHTVLGVHNRGLCQRRGQCGGRL